MKEEADIAVAFRMPEKGQSGRREPSHITDCPVGSVAPFLISCADLTLPEVRPPTKN